MEQSQLGKSHEDIEWRLLICLSKLGFGQGDVDACSVTALKEINWQRLVQLTKFHRVRSLVHHGIMQWDKKHLVPENILEELKSIHHQRSYINLDHAKEMIKLISLLAEKGVEVIPYKGVILGQEAYGNMSLREMSDIDILIDLGAFQQVRETLLQRDYSPAKHVPEEFETIFFNQNFEYNFDLYEAGKRKYHVEPHWKIGFKRWQTDLDFHDILPLTRKSLFFGTQINMLTPEGLLLTTCLHHGGEDRWNSLKYICDVAAILFKFEKELDWQLLLLVLEKFKVRNIVLLGIGVAIETFDVPVPDDVRVLLGSRKLKGHVRKVEYQLISSKRSANINTYFKDIRFHFSLRKKLSTKFKVLYYHLIQIFTPTIYDINDEKSAGKKYWWLFITKPLRIWRTHVK